MLQVYIAASASFSVGGDEQGGGGKDKGKQPSREARKRKIDDIDSGVEPTILHKAVESHLKRDYRYFTTSKAHTLAMSQSLCRPRLIRMRCTSVHRSSGSHHCS